jgi:hypothetical protein
LNAGHSPGIGVDSSQLRSNNRCIAAHRKSTLSNQPAWWEAQPKRIRETRAISAGP